MPSQNTQCMLPFVVHESTRIKVLHIWDTKMDSGINIDDLLERTPLIQRSVSRVLVGQGAKKPIDQRGQHQIETVLSPYPVNRIARLISKLKFRVLLKQEIESSKPDLVFFHFGQTAATYINLVRRFRVPFMVAIYGHDISVALNQLRWQLKYKIFAKTDGRFLVLAEDVKQRLTNLNVNASNIDIYNYPIDINPYLDASKVQQDDRFRLTIPGRLVEKKGHIFLFQALRVLKSRNIIVHLNVVGYGGDRDYYQRLASDIGVNDQISWIDTTQATVQGNFDQLYRQVLEETDLVVLPCITSNEGDNEAGPALVLCLAQASGTPVLTTPFKGHEISITDGSTGLLSAEGNSIDLANKIVWAISNPDELGTIARAGKLLVLDLFDLDANINHLFELITKAHMRGSESREI